MADTKDQGGKQIHWYPGHMASASRELKSAWRHIDAVVEIADARIPVASRNPLFLDFQPKKPHLLLLSHADLADGEVNKAWQAYYLDQALTAVFCDLRNAADIRFIRRRLLLFQAPLLEKAKSQGRLVRPLRVLVTGIPNTGKSTFINQFVGKKSARVESRPGVTRQQSWLRSGSDLHFLDTPGILPPKLADRDISLGLAATGAIRDSILPLEEVARWLFDRLAQLYPQALTQRYGSREGLSSQEAFEAAALAMGCHLAGGRPDLIRFSKMLVDDFRSKRIDRISLERPPQEKKPMTEPKKTGMRISQGDRDRFEAMAVFEKELATRGYRAVAGVDEAGRGPLAGPVLAAACILPSEAKLYGLNDSKKMTPKRREILYDQIRQQATAWAIAMVDQEEIDRTDILSATKEAMRRALLELPVKPDLALIDAVALEGLDFPVLAKTQGDAQHNVIAAASVLAKVARDRLMINWDKVYPQYGFAAHKGYGTQAHREALERHGPCPLHRISFLSSFDFKTPKAPTADDKGWQTEWAVARDLIGRGHTILAHRYRLQGLGDIDFITARKRRLYVIECKGRGPGTDSYGGIESALREDQIRRIRRLADLWLASQPAYADWPLELLYAAAVLDRQGGLVKLDYLPF